MILISSLSLIGYILTRWLGPATGTALTGLTGGLVSSTAVTFAVFLYFRDGAAARGKVSVKNPFSLLAAARVGRCSWFCWL